MSYLFRYDWSLQVISLQVSYLAISDLLQVQELQVAKK